MNDSSLPAPSRPGERGFTLMELLVTLAILTVVLLGTLALFDMASRISRVQVDVSDLQQGQRAAQYEIVRTLRMAGRGGVPLQERLPTPLTLPYPQWSLPNGIAVSVRNEVPPESYMDPPAFTRKILAGTDVLTIRGVITNPVCNVVAESFRVDLNPGATFGRGQLQVRNLARPGVPVPQSLETLGAAIRGRFLLPLILVSPLDDSFYHVVELDPDASRIDEVDADDRPVQVTVRFRAAPADGFHTGAYWQLSGSDWDPQLTDAAFMGILEEYRYYVLEERENPADPASGVKASLARARFFPGTNTASGELAEVVADNVSDLQVALGVESGGASPFTLDDGGSRTDEWLFNHPDDDDQEARWRTGRLFYVRLSTTTVSERRDRNFLAPATAQLEDHVYTVPERGQASPQAPDRTYRRRTLRTVVDLRNL